MGFVQTGRAERLRIVELPHPADVPTFAQDVERGLLATPKTLPSKYFYDALGSTLFDAITLLPEYYLTRAETEILREWGWEMVRALDAPIELLELGSGSAAKTRILIEEALRVQGRLHYSPIDISPQALRASADALIAAYDGIAITAYAADYFTVLASDTLTFTRAVLALFLGSNIGNYDPADAAALLGALGRRLRSGDGLLLGVDLKKDRRTLELAYDDPAGVTAAFDKNVLGRINRELGGTFDLADFRHVAVYDEQCGRVDSFLEAQRNVTVEIAATQSRIVFASGERIHTESSYKYDPAGIERLAREAGFKLRRSWFDGAQRFSVNLLVKP